MSSRAAVFAGIALGAVAIGYSYSRTPNTDSKASPANQSRRSTDTIAAAEGDLSLKGVERSGGGV